MITLCTPKIFIIFFSSFFFTKYKNKWKERKFRRQKKKQKSDFCKNQKVLKIDDNGVNKVSKEEPYGTKNSFKYFIGYNDDDVIRPL